MGFQISTLKASLNSGNNNFSFSDDIATYLVGISSFYLTYGPGIDHHVEQVSIGISASQPTSSTISVYVNAQLSDADGHQIDTSNSYVNITVLAWVGASQGTLLLTMPPTTLDNGETSDNINLPGSPAVLSAAVAGFTLSYDNTDHEVLLTAAGVSAGANGAEGTIKGMANMYDASGNQASTAQVDGVLLASSISNPGFVVVPYSGNSNTPVQIDMKQSVSQVVCLLTGFQASYSGDSDHHISVIGAGPNQVQLDPSDNSKVNCNGIWSFMWDTSDNLATGSCNLIFVGVV